MSTKDSKTKQPITLHGVRVRFYLCDFDECFLVRMPCRINTGDSFYIDDFISVDEKGFKKETINSLYNDCSILECQSSIFGKDDQGIYQQCYLTKRP